MYSYKSISIVLILAVLSSCCRCNDIENIAYRHEEKLRKYFLLGRSTTDVSTLIAETRDISARLKRACLKERANKFDSYTDVLMYGNNTIDESLNDVMILTKTRKCPSVRGFMNRICDCQ